MSFMKYFHDVRDGYFVDAGAFDPLYISTSAALVAQGWNGIFIEASPTRARRFIEQR